MTMNTDRTVAVLIEHGEENGCVGPAEFTELVAALELETTRSDDVYRELEAAASR